MDQSQVVAIVAGNAIPWAANGGKHNQHAVSYNYLKTNGLECRDEKS
jgi:hypothetical protein